MECNGTSRASTSSATMTTASSGSGTPPARRCRTWSAGSPSRRATTSLPSTPPLRSRGWCGRARGPVRARRARPWGCAIATGGATASWACVGATAASSAWAARPGRARATAMRPRRCSLPVVCSAPSRSWLAGAWGPCSSTPRTSALRAGRPSPWSGCWRSCWRWAAASRRSLRSPSGPRSARGWKWAASSPAATRRRRPPTTPRTTRPRRAAAACCARAAPCSTPTVTARFRAPRWWPSGTRCRSAPSTSSWPAASSTWCCR